MHGIVIKLSTHFYAQGIGCSNLMHQMFQKLKGHCNTLHGKKTFPICRQCCHKHASQLLFRSRETTISHKGSLALSCCIQGALYYVPPMTSQNCAIDASDCVIVQIVHDPEIQLIESLCTCAKLPNLLANREVMFVNAFCSSCHHSFVALYTNVSCQC